MKMDKVAGSGNDEFYTSLYAIKPIMKYLPKDKNVTIWCPFDTENSLFVKTFKKAGYKVVTTHLDEGYDFFDFKKEQIKADYIISNPPYSCKRQVLERLFELDIPFAMLVGVVGLFGNLDKDLICSKIMCLKSCTLIREYHISNLMMTKS